MFGRIRIASRSHTPTLRCGSASRRVPQGRSIMNRRVLHSLTVVLGVLIAPGAAAQLAVRGGVVHTMAGEPIENGVVLIRDGKIEAVGRAADIAIPDGWRVLEAPVVTPGLVDVRSTVGLTGIYNHPHDQDQLDRSGPMQPELRAIDAYNPREQLIGWVRSFGVTTVHTGHAPGELISGQTIIVKTRGATVEAALLRSPAAVAATLDPSAQRSDSSPGTRGKMMAMLRAELIRAREHLEKRERAEEDSPTPRDLRLESLGLALRGEAPLMITANRAQDIASALRLADEFGFTLWLDSAVESYVMADEILAAGAPVLLHPTMMRSVGVAENLSFETAAKLADAGIPMAIQSGFEGYVPKVRVVLFEAAIAAANGLGFERALRSITIDAARILGIEDRVGSIEVGKDGDLALYSGDPFEYTSQCLFVVIEGEVVSDEPR